MFVYQSRIYRADLRANPMVSYVFGDNTLRQGMGGQAGEMRGEPNAIGIVTKWIPSNDEESFFSDKDYDEIVALIDDDYRMVSTRHVRGEVVVIPLDGIGTGLSDLPARAPRIYSHLCSLGLGGDGL